MGSFPVFVDPVVQGAFEEIDRSALSTTATAITFSGIDSATFPQLRIWGFIAGAAANLDVRYNNDSGGNYGLQTMTANGTAFTGSGGVAQIQQRISLVSVVAALSMLLAKVDASTRLQMVGHIGANNGSDLARAEFFGGYWNNTVDLLDRIDLLHTTFQAGTFVVLEGDQTT